MNTITSITIIDNDNNENIRIINVNKAMTKQQLEIYRQRLKTVLGKRTNKNLNVFFTYRN